MHPLINRLSDHDAHIITINNITVDEPVNKTQSIRKFNKFSIHQFANNLSYENWDNVFIKEEVNTVFNNFLNTCLRIFNSSFLLHTTYSTHNNITTAITNSCQHKTELYLISTDSNNPKLTLSQQN
jgi:predicted AAA+ superfamily ATPase